jgi:FKBP-type peptidyl-prolyl cis-trans isomerase FklB
MNQSSILIVFLILFVIALVFITKRNSKLQKDLIAKSLADGKAFLLENATKEGVVVCNSGLQYIILKEGEGPKPTLRSKVTTHYHGTLIDGKVFDSSVDRGQPASFGVYQVIKGWQEGIPLMSKGAKYRFFIPQELAYGMQSPSRDIPGGSALIFEVELISFN